MPETNDRALWDLFDQAQTGELQAAESRKRGLAVNPHYLRGNLRRTITVARSMKLVPWIQDVYAEHGSAYLETDVLRDSYKRWHGLDSDEAVTYEFYGGLLSLQQTGLVNRGSRQNDEGETSSIRSIGTRAIKANYREVLQPPVPSCLGLLARGGGAVAGATAAMWADMELFNIEVNGIIDRASQALFVGGVSVMALTCITEVETNINAARIRHQYIELGY